MNIGIDITQMIYGTGSSVYTYQLVKNLLEIDKENSYNLLAGTLRRKQDIVNLVKPFPKNYQLKLTLLSPQLADFLWNRLHIISVETFLGKVDIFHSSDWTQPPTRARKVTTVHDLSPLLMPEYTDPRIVSVHKRRLGWIKKEVDAIIVPSKSTKNDLVKLGFSESKIDVIYEAPDDLLKPASKEEIQAVKLKYGIKSEYYLTVGVNKRKNIDRLIEAFESVNLKDTQLVIIGRNTSEIRAKSNNIIFTGHVKESEKSAFYSGAQALVYPSLYEGFGLPILEAFVCGCPVITSTISSMPEIAGEAALLVDPNKVEEIANALTVITKTSDVYRKKGFLRAKDFTWKKNAEETLSLYDRLK